jgi:hydrogenase expression/formation protein HypC
MCLGIPGKIVELYESNSIQMAKIDFGGVMREACIQTLPEAIVGDYTIIHAGFALSILSEDEARETLDALAELSLIEQELGPQDY